jgi:CheY-like chemotaxis protein
LDGSSPRADIAPAGRIARIVNICREPDAVQDIQDRKSSYGVRARRDFTLHRTSRRAAIIDKRFQLRPIAMDPVKPSIAVLVVEDDVLIRIDVAAIITDAGFKVYEAGTADQAVVPLEQCADILVLFTDVNMPGSMDGLELAHYVRVNWPLKKIMVTSGQRKIATQELPHESVFLGKPYRPAHIVQKLREMAA